MSQPDIIQFAQRLRHGGEFVFSGRGEVRRSAMGRYIAKVLDIAGVHPSRRARLKGRVAELLWGHLQGESTTAARRDYIHALMEELRVDRRNEGVKRRLVDATLELFRFFEDQINEHELRPCEVDIGGIDRAAPRGFLSDSRVARDSPGS